MVRGDLANLSRGGVKPTAGDIRCVGFGHIIRLAIWYLRPKWKRDLPTAERIAAVRLWIDKQLGGVSAVLDALADEFAKAPSRQPLFLREDPIPYEAEEATVSF